MISKKIILIKTCFSLGLLNILRVVYYQARKKLRLFPASYTVLTTNQPFYNLTPLSKKTEVTENWDNEANYFGWFKRKLNKEVPPNWHENPYNGYIHQSIKPWFELPDFDEDQGDIKWIWEASRFSWVLIISQRGSINDLKQLNFWIDDWLRNNPPYFGINWKCGQEASLRVLNLAMGACILNQEKSSTNRLIDLVKLHLIRIRSTFRYALAQNNNHSISEAVALFVGGSWLRIMNVSQGKHYESLGRSYIEKQSNSLIMEDGSYSQYSVNYHAVMLEMFSIAEIWRCKLELPVFSASFYEKLYKAVLWLAVLVNSETGDAPNIGANDSSRFFPSLSATRDYRPIVQLGAVLFAKSYIYDLKSQCNVILHWFDLHIPSQKINPVSSNLFDKGGLAVLKNEDSLTVLRYPRFKFRPSQCDLLHLDFWIASTNILRDAGSYTYSSMQEIKYFSGTNSHNTIEFNQCDQMPHLSRFLFGNWLCTKNIEPLKIESSKLFFSVSYIDNQGAYHKRSIILSNKQLEIIDEIANFNNATLRWRLASLDWQLINNEVFSEKVKLSIVGDMPILKISLKKGWESRNYLQKTECDIVEVKVNRPGKLITIIRWK